MKFRETIMSLAALALVAAPVAAQAGTSAASAMPSVSGRVSAPVASEQKADAGTWILGLAAAGLVIYGLIIAFDDDDNKSRGSN